MRRISIVALAVVALGACSASTDTASSSVAVSTISTTATTPTTAPSKTPTTTAQPTSGDSAAVGELTCSVEGLDFTTALASCEEALSTGRQLAVTAGLATGADTPAAGIAVGAMCRAIQGSEPKSAGQANINFAQALNDRRVCLGDLSLLTLDPNA